MQAPKLLGKVIPDAVGALRNLGGALKSVPPHITTEMRKAPVLLSILAALGVSASALAHDGDKLTVGNDFQDASPVFRQLGVPVDTSNAYAHSATAKHWSAKGVTAATFAATFDGAVTVGGTDTDVAAGKQKLANIRALSAREVEQVVNVSADAPVMGIAQEPIPHIPNPAPDSVGPEFVAIKPDNVHSRPVVKGEDFSHVDKNTIDV